MSNPCWGPRHRQVLTHSGFYYCFFDNWTIIFNIIFCYHSLFQKLSNATCLCNSTDGQYIFMGLPCGMVVLDALSHQIIGSWEEDGAEMTYISSYIFAPEVYLITTIDDMGW